MDRITQIRVRLLEARAELAEAELDAFRCESGAFTRCVYCVLPQGWGWLPVTELDPLGEVEGEWVPNELLMPSQAGGGAEDRQDGDLLPPFGALAARGFGQIPTDLLKDLLRAQMPVGPHVVDDACCGIPSQVADRR